MIGFQNHGLASAEAVIDPLGHVTQIGGDTHRAATAGDAIAHTTGAVMGRRKGLHRGLLVQSHGKFGGVSDEALPQGGAFGGGQGLGRDLGHVDGKMRFFGQPQETAGMVAVLMGHKDGGDVL